MKRTAPNGFTLLELLVALVVLGFILAGLTQGVRFGLLGWVTQTRMSSAHDDLDAVDRTLRHLIEEMNPGVELDPAPFAGGRNSMDCITILPGTVPARRIEATLSVDSRQRLVLRWRPYLHAEYSRPPLAMETELLSGVARMELAFWGPAGSWVETWRSPDLPALIRIRLRFAPGDRRQWPDIVAAPLLDRP
jgi:general secretion pathway protein J